jgi:hypothetical protein
MQANWNASHRIQVVEDALSKGINFEHDTAWLIPTNLHKNYHMLRAMKIQQVKHTQKFGIEIQFIVEEVLCINKITHTAHWVDTVACNH